MIFHNGLFDLLYIYQSFVADLPEDYFEFKKVIKKGFPYLYDTKYLSNLDIFN
jgi:target of EGR1 protein 1